MLASIHPLGERARDNRWTLTAAAYATGSVLGGIVAGSAAGLAGWLALSGLGRHSIGPTVAASAGVVVALAFELGQWRLPGPARQVDKAWLERYRGWVYGAGFGFQLGFGVVTIVTTATVYLWLALAFLTRSTASGAIVGAVFGLTRAIPLGAVRTVNDGAGLRAVHARLERAAPRVRAASAAALAAVALISASAAVHG